MFAAIFAAFKWIGTIFGLIGPFRDSVLYGVIAAIWNALNATGGKLKDLGIGVWHHLRDAWDKVHGRAIADIFRHPIQSLKDLWEKVLKPGWAKFNKWIDRAHDWLKTKFGPIVAWLGKARKYLTIFYTRFLKPILEIIDVARAVLKILSQLGIDWAKQLDAKLAALEDWIVGKFTEVYTRITRAEDWINRIVDLDGLFQRVILLRSLFRDVGDAWNVLVGSGSNPITDDQRGALAETPDAVDNAEIATVVRPYFASGDASRTELQAEIGLLWLAHLRR